VSILLRNIRLLAAADWIVDYAHGIILKGVQGALDVVVLIFSINILAVDI
jgi:hypothetical protein